MNFLTTTVCAIALSTVATMSFADMAKVSEIDVKVDLSAVSEADALTHWPGIADDLEKAIAAKVETSDSEDAYRVEVSIDEIKLDDLYVLPDNGEFNRIEGVVAVYQNGAGGNTASGNADGGTGVAPVQSYPLKLEAFRNDTPVPEGWIRVPATSDDFYGALIDAFADKVATNLEAM